MNTLAFGYDLPTAGRPRDFHPPERAPAGRAKKRLAKKQISLKKYFSTGVDTVSMTYGKSEDYELIVVDGANNAVITNPISPLPASICC